jgi:hypothetical protein
MRVSELLTAIATWLESYDNEALLLAEYDDKCLEIVAKSCIQAAEVLKQGAIAAEQVEPAEEPKLTPEALDHLNQVITAFDQSGDADLQKTATLMDELLLSIAAPPDWVNKYRAKEDNHIETLKKLYHDPKKQIDEVNDVKGAAKAIDKSEAFKEYRIMQAPLSTRTCLEHPGAQMARVGNSQWQCSLDGKVFDYEAGFTTERGEKIPPAGAPSVANQTPAYHIEPHAIFDNRQERLFGWDPSKK